MKRKFHFLIFSFAIALTFSTPQCYGSSVTIEKEEYPELMNLSLLYRPLPEFDYGIIKMRVSDLPKDGTFDLSQFEEVQNHLKITTNPSVFFTVDRVPPPQIKGYILIASYRLIKDNIESVTKPFKKIMKQWDKNKHPIGIFWRPSDEEDLTDYHYLTNCTIEEISSDNLYKHWHHRDIGGYPYNALRRQWDSSISKNFTLIDNKFDNFESDDR